MGKKKNKGEWSELYVFIRLLKEGKIFVVNGHSTQIKDQYYPISKIVRIDTDGHSIDYLTGQIIRIYKKGNLIGEISNNEISENVDILLNHLIKRSISEKQAFEISIINPFLDKMKIKQIKAPTNDKVDIRMQIRDNDTNHDKIVGFSIKSDIGMPPTLLNAGKNTRFKYEILGINDNDMKTINSVNKSIDKEYIKARIEKLFTCTTKINYHSMKSDTYKSNLMLIDNMLPEIYGNFILYHYLMISQPIDCETLCEKLEIKNPLKYQEKNIYKNKIKKLLCASALGMTPGKKWDGIEAVNGGYIVVKHNGDIVCYHLYDRTFFENYLLKNTTIDRPSATRHDYAYIYKENGHYYIDLNIQIRFKSINSNNEIQ